MSMIEKLPEFTRVNQALQEINVSACGAEAHGLMCGFICAGSKLNGQAWFAPLLGLNGREASSINTTNQKILLELYQTSSQQLHGMEFGFEILLPDDETQLNIRAQALSKWCEGFLAGLGLAGIQIDKACSPDVREALFHCSEISKLDHENIVAREEDEKAFTQIFEYVRTMTLLVHSEFALDEMPGNDHFMVSRMDSAVLH